MKNCELAEFGSFVRTRNDAAFMHELVVDAVAAELALIVSLEPPDPVPEGSPPES